MTQPHTLALQGKTVLIVEDTAVNRLILERWLARLGMSIDSAACIADARTLLPARQYDAVLLDRFLPDGEGFCLLPQIRQQMHSLTIAMTAIDSEAEYAATLAYGFDAVLRKPVVEVALLSALAGIACKDAQEEIALTPQPPALGPDRILQLDLLQSWWDQGQVAQLKAALDTAAQTASGYETPSQRALHALRLALETPVPNPMRVQLLLDALAALPAR